MCGQRNRKQGKVSFESGTHLQPNKEQRRVQVYLLSPFTLSLPALFNMIHLICHRHIIPAPLVQWSARSAADVLQTQAK
jgi:hypothetical protein